MHSTLPPDAPYLNFILEFTKGLYFDKQFNSVIANKSSLDQGFM
jgi:hypothetical protein